MEPADFGSIGAPLHQESHQISISGVGSIQLQERSKGGGNNRSMRRVGISKTPSK